MAGGKGANLGELVRHGLPVPDGFVITTHAYELVARGRETREHFETVEPPGELREAITDAYARLGGGPVAVRSSATAEDLPGAAFAGQQDTFLNVAGEQALLDAVRRCWASLWTDRAVAYRARLRLDDSEVRIAVVVQRMVEAETAGVMFTANPVTGDRTQLVVDAGRGLGEAVVSGLVTPDHYVLRPSGEVVDFRPGRGEVVVRSAEGGGVVHESPAEPPESAAGAQAEARAGGQGGGQGGGLRGGLGGGPGGGPGAGAERGPVPGTPGSLSDEVQRELATLGGRVAEVFGRPQDIEWAHVAGRLHLLQARPMTALPPPPVGPLDGMQRKTAEILMEYLPERPYPMDMSSWLPNGPAGQMSKVFAAYGVRNLIHEALKEEDGVVYRIVPVKPSFERKVLTAPFRALRKARRYDPARWTEDSRFQAYMKDVEKLRALDLGELPWEELRRVPRQAMDLVGPVADLRIDYLPGVGLALLRLMLGLTLLGRRKLFGELLLGAPTRTSDANRALERLAETARRTGALEAERPPAEFGPDSGPEFGPEFAAELADFMAEYGHRETASPILITPPTWADAPEVVLDLVRVLAAAPPKERKEQAGPPVRPRWLARRAAAARAGMVFREDSHFSFMMPAPVMRRALVEMGRRLAQARLLDRPDDVFHLRLEELESLRGTDDPAAARLRDVARRRAAKREELSGVRLIDPAAVHPVTDPGPALLTGAAAGGGTATGPVKVIANVAEFGRLEPGDVLVCPYTNPSWTPLFQRAAAVVVDTGGAASHAAIVAREYGIPAVMGTGRGTSVLENGLLVTVNGDTGTVTAAP
ncbi:PEP/pyruvate-binding domain-containing protein [Nonomuraea sp. NPDC004580]|uniref:PEP/pyruvate-binding domain-containing protein n=1 Tax=Nonomuraea sp. NPDC004580 TaxID=3154552 RepID=UPI0033B071B3